MLKAMCAATLLAVLVGVLRGEELPTAPTSPAPYRAVVSIDAGGILQLEQTVTRQVVAARTKLVYGKTPGTKDSEGLRYEVVVGPGPESVTTTRRVDTKAVAGFDKTGRRIDVKDPTNLLWERTEVLISADGKAVDPSCLKDEVEGTVILIFPQADVPPPPLPTASTDEEDAKAEKAIEALGGIVLRDEVAPVRPIIGADLQDSKLTDVELKTGLRELAGVEELRKILGYCEFRH